MMTARAAKRYAQAAFAIARERNELERWLVDLRTLREVLQDPHLVAFLDNPRISVEVKRRLLSERLSSVVSPLVLNLVYLLIEERRIGLLSQIVAEFERVLNDYQGIAVAEVTTAIPLDADMQEMLVAQLSQRTGKRVVLRTHVDPSIIGGLIARIGDQVLDGSVRTRLAALKRSLAGVD